MPVYLLVYGTLKSRMIDKEALGHTDAGRLAFVTGYKGESFRIGTVDYPTIVPKKDESVRGELLTLKEGDLAKLDQWESHYVRKRIKTSTGYMAWTYVLKAEHMGKETQ